MKMSTLEVEVKEMATTCVALCKRSRGNYPYYGVTTYHAGEDKGGNPIWVRGEEVTGATTPRKGERLAREYAARFGWEYMPEVRHRAVRVVGTGAGAVVGGVAGTGTGTRTENAV